LNNEQGWVGQLRKTLQHKRDVLSAALAEGGFDVRRSDGSYFVCADIAPLGESDAAAFCRALPERIGVAAVPVSVFTDHPEDWNRLVRFTFCKREETLARGLERLHHLR
jgi:N-succinyldiaminopimelate aminotransferase